VHTVLRSCTIALLAVTPLPGRALGQSGKDDRTRETLRRAQQMIRKLEQEKVGLERKKQELAERVSALERELWDAKSLKARAQAEGRGATGLEKDLRASRQETEAVRTARGELEASLEALKKEATVLHARVGEAEQAASSREAQAKLQFERMTQQEKRIGACETANAKLYESGLACIARYEKDVLPRHEPFTGIGRTRMENALEQYRDRFDAHRIVGTPR